jgi:acetyl esterase/lipase
LTPSPRPSPTPTPAPSPTPTPSTPGDVVVEREIPFTPNVACGDRRCRLRLDVWHPENEGDWPVIVSLHGRPRTRADMEPIARLLAAQGAVIFNADYRGSGRVERGYPMSFEDAACAVRFARASAADYGGDPSRIVLVGHSFGTYVGSVVTLNGDAYEGACLAEDGSAEPDAFVGLSGSYHWHDEPIWTTFFGGRLAANRSRWRDGDPHTHIGGNPDSEWWFVTERTDPILDPDSSSEFHETLLDAGYDSDLETLDGSGHFTILRLNGDAEAAAETIAGAAGIEE